MKPPYSKEDVGDAKYSVELGPLGGRDLDSYLRLLEIPLEDLKGKKILDLGSGKRLKLADDLKEKNIDAEVYSFSPIFAETPARATAALVAEPDSYEKTVAGMGEALPYADESFDRVIALHVFEYVDEAERRSAFVLEVCRVLAPGGIAYIGPLHGGEEYLRKLVPNSNELPNHVHISFPELKKRADAAHLVRLEKDAEATNYE